MQSIKALLFITLLLPLLAKGQTDWPISLSWQNNQAAKPFQEIEGFFRLPIHSSVTFGTSFGLNNDSTHKLIQTGRLGYLYHQYNQKALQLYSEFTYQYQINQHWSSFIRLGGGYIRSFPDMASYALSNGQFDEMSNNGRSQLMITASLGFQYHIVKNGRETLRLRLAYQPWFQYPFVNEYVPFLPYTAINIGVEKPIRWDNE